MEASMTIGGDDGGDGAVEVSISIPAGQQVAPNLNQDVRFLAQSMETIGREIPMIPTTQRVIGQVFIPIVKNEEFELTSIINRGSDVDSASTILTEIELNDYTEPKGKAFLLATYIPLILLIRAIGVSLAHPLVRISVAIFVVAFLNLGSLTFAYYVLKNSPQRRYFSPRLYMILNFTYYILWFLAHVLLLPVIFISHDH